LAWIQSLACFHVPTGMGKCLILLVVHMMVCVCVCVWTGMSSKNSDSSFAKTSAWISPVSYCMNPPCSLLYVSAKHNVPSSKSCTFVTTDNQTHIEMTLLTLYEVYNLILKLGHKVMQYPVWHGLYTACILYYITSYSRCHHR
jgi:hypothetical protein